MNNMVGIVVTIVMGVIGYSIVDDVISTQSWNSTLTTTVMGYIPVFGALGLMAAAVSFAFS